LHQICENGVDAVLDFQGGEWPAQCEGLCHDGSRLVTVASWTAPAFKKRISFTRVQNYPHAGYLTALAHYFDEGLISVHVDKVWKLDEVEKAFDELEKGHTKGKAVVKVEPAQL